MISIPVLSLVALKCLINSGNKTPKLSVKPRLIALHTAAEIHTTHDHELSWNLLPLKIRFSFLKVFSSPIWIEFFLRFPYLRELSKITKLSRAKKMEWIATMRLRMQIKPSRVLQNNITPRATFDWRIKSFPGLGTCFGDINQTELCMILCLFQLVRTFLSH